MRQFLMRHPGSDHPAAAGIQASAARLGGGCLELSYTVTGKLEEICIPAVTASARSDQLWRHTCFEAFVRASSANEYYEFNFSPSTQWAAYRFSGYRSEMRQATNISPPIIEISATSDVFTLKASLELGHWAALKASASWRLGLSAVLEDTTGRKSYWALAHPPGRPDFHHPDCFVQELSSTVGS